MGRKLGHCPLLSSNKDSGNRLSWEHMRQARLPQVMCAVDSPPELQSWVPVKADTWPWMQVIVRKVTPGDSILIKRQIKNAVACGTQDMHRPVKGRREATGKRETSVNLCQEHNS